MRTHSVLALLLLLSSRSAAPTAAGDDLTTILERLYSASGPPRPCTGSAAQSICSAAAHQASSMKSDGSWPDLKYSKPISNNKLPVDHWERLTTVAKAVHCGGCAAAGRPALQAKIASGISYWRTNNFLDPNWWMNDFGAPMAIEKLLVVMANSTTGPPLAPADAEYGITLLKRGTDPMWRPLEGSGGHYTGENLVWSLQIDIQRGALTGNASLVRSAFEKMWASMVISPQHGDGLMADGSFHQHGPLLQSGSYGNGLMTDILNFIELSAGTSFVIPAEPLKVFVHYLTIGQCNMLRAGKGVEVATWNVPPRGREITRTGNGPFPSEAVAAGINAVLKLPGLDAASKDELRRFAGVLRNQLPPPSRTRHFPDSDYTTHHRRGFSQDVRTWSKRTENAECVNAENQFGAHLADGAAYTMVSGTEYHGIFPVWDWRKVPGVLARQEHSVAPACHFETMGATDFVGGVELAEQNWAAVTMDFSHGPPTKHLQDLELLATSSEVYVETPDPTCKNGLRNGAFCCPKSCNECGGKKCDDPPNVGADCCVTAIAKNGRECAKVSAPCNMNRLPPPPPPGQRFPLTAKRSWFLLDEGFLSLTAGASLAANDFGVAVALEQSRLDGPIASSNWVNDEIPEPQPVSSGGTSFALTEKMKAVVVTHHNISYVALGGALLPSVGGRTPTLRASVGPQTGSWHNISTEKRGGSVTMDVFKLWLDLGPAPLSGGSAGYAVLPGADAATVADVFRWTKVLANSVERQVVRLGSDSMTTIMAVVHSGEDVFTESEAGFSLKTNGTFLLGLTARSKNFKSAQGISFSFSRPSGGAGMVRLTATGLPAALRTNSSDAGGSVRCSGGTIELSFPAALGRTATGSCLAGSDPPAKTDDTDQSTGGHQLNSKRATASEKVIQQSFLQSRGQSWSQHWRESTLGANQILTLDGGDWRVDGEGRGFSASCTGGGPTPGSDSGCGVCEANINYTAPAVGAHGWYSVYSLGISWTQKDCVELCAATAGCAAAVWTNHVNGHPVPTAGSGCGFRTAAEVAQGKYAANGTTACIPADLHQVVVNIPATVPGDLVTDLQRAGMVKDPLSSNNHKDPSQVQFWNGESYTYTKNFTVDASIRKTAIVRLVLNSVKMGASISLNGNFLGNATNQFLRYTYEIAALLVNGQNTLSIRFDRSIDTGGRFMGCSGGWDWAPYSRMRDSGGRAEWTRGITGSVYLAVTDATAMAIDALSPTILYKGVPPTSLLQDDGSHSFDVNVTAHLFGGKSARGSLIVTGSWGVSKRVPVSMATADDGVVAISVILEASGVKLWWPRGTVSGQ